MVSAYSEPEDLIILIESHDLFGKECFYYIHKFDLSSILNTPIFDKYIAQKWNGRVSIECSVADFSTVVSIIKNENEKILSL